MLLLLLLLFDHNLETVQDRR